MGSFINFFHFKSIMVAYWGKLREKQAFLCVYYRIRTRSHYEPNYCTECVYLYTLQQSIQHTLYGLKYWATPLHLWIKAFSPLLSGVCKIKCSKVLVEFECDTVIGCHCCNKSNGEISSLRRYSTISCEWYYCRVETVRESHQTRS